MKTYLKSIVTGALGTAAWLVISTSNAQPQDGPPADRQQRGNFDPQQMRQRMLERLRDQLGVKDDAEWKAISERIEKVTEARRSAGGLGGPGTPGGFGFAAGRPGMGGVGRPGGFGGPGGPPPQRGEGRPDAFGPADGPPGAPDRPDGAPQAPPQMRNRPGGPPARGAFPSAAGPEMEALRKAIAQDASASEIKAKLAALRAAQQKQEAELEKAQDQLRQLLSARQEAIAVTLGLLK